MDLRKLIFTENNAYKSGKKHTVKGIMWHSTGANNPDLKRYVGPDDGALGKNKYGNHFNTAKPGGINICPHAFIGKLANGSIATYQVLPWDMVGWHSGTGTKGSKANANNNGYIGFEICEDGLKDEAYFNAVYREACELTAYLCKTYNLDPLADGVIICHADGNKMGIASNHGDVLHWFKNFGKTMDDVRKDVKALMTPVAVKPAGSAPVTGLYRVQCGAFKTPDNAKRHSQKLLKAGYKNFIVEVDGLHKVQVGAFEDRSNAVEFSKKLVAIGFGCYIVEPKGTTAQASSKIGKGDRVRVKEGAKSYSGQKIAAFVYKQTYTVDQLSGDRAVLGEDSICTAFNVKDLAKI